MKPNWSPVAFDEEYFTTKARNGLGAAYRYEDEGQQQQLALKAQLCDLIPHQSVLFVGCATGFEVAFWRSALSRNAWGVDVSEWAIENAHPIAKPWVRLFDGWNLKAHDTDSFDLVAAFDVVTLVDKEVMTKLAEEMVRVAKSGIVVRTLVKSYRNLTTEVDGIDGVYFQYRLFHEWDELFTASGKFKLWEAKTHGQYETHFLFTRA